MRHSKKQERMNHTVKKKKEEEATETVRFQFYHKDK